jgi:importin subunit beta-1
VQGLLCGVLQVIIQKLSETDATKAGVTAYADNIMEALLSVFACHSSTVHEEAMLAVGALTYACGTQFNKYMERFYPILEKGLTNYQVLHHPLMGRFTAQLTLS